MNDTYLRRALAANSNREPLTLDASAEPAPIKVSRLLLTYLLFWPLLYLIARQAPYFAGPARDAAFIQQGRAAGEGANDHLFLYLMLLMESICAISYARSIINILKRNPLIQAGLILALLSAIWSPSIVLTIHLWVALLLTTLFACYLAIRMPAERLMRQFMFMGVCASLLSILFVIALPSYGLFAGYGEGAWQGICDHKNTLGLSMSYLLTPAFFADFGRWRRLSYIGLILFLIVMSQSRGAWLYALGVLAFVGCLNLVRRLRAHESVALVIILCLLCSAVAVAAIGSFGTITSALGKSESMTGRTDIYREVYASVKKAPILGYGYSGFWGVNPEAYRVGLAISWTNIGYAESGILELALQLGIVGVILALAMIGRALIQGIRLVRSPHYRPRIGWYLTILWLAVLTNIDAGWLMVPGTLDWVLILIACIGLDAESRRVRTAGIADATDLWASTVDAGVIPAVLPGVTQVAGAPMPR